MVARKYVPFFTYLVWQVLMFSLSVSNLSIYGQQNDKDEELEVKDILVVENFEEPLGFQFELYESSKGKSYLEDGVFVLEAYTDSGMSRYIEFDMPKEPDEMIIHAKMKLTKGRSMGLIFLFEDWDNYGWFLLDNDGNLSLGFVDEAQTYYIVRSVPVFSYYPKDFNDVKIVQTDRSIKVYVNGYVELTNRAVPLEGKNFGFIVSGHSAMAVDEFALGYKLLLKKEGDIAARFFGSGLILDSFHVLTAFHVVEDATKIYVTLMEESEEKANIPAKILYKDEKLDIAILKTDSPMAIPAYVPYAIKKSGILPLGSYVYTLGFPLVHAGMGKSIKFQDGKISSKVGYENDPSQYQTTIPAAPGYSGAPVFDENGNLIGILTAKHKIAENASYVVKASSFVTLLDLIDNLNLPNESTISTQKIDSQVEQLIPYVVIIKAQ